MTYAYDEVALECEFAGCRTFGSVIRFALDLETTAAAFYGDSASKGLVKDAMAELFSAYAKDHQKRKELLEHTRREKLNEMILEPISDIHSENYKPDLPKKLDGLNEATAVKTALEIEQKSASFYIETAKVAKSLLAEAARIMDKLGKENQVKAEKIRSL